MSAISVSLLAEAENVRREAQIGSLREFRYPHNRSEAFGRAAALFEGAAAATEARECSWDAQLWRVGTARLSTLKRGEEYFRPIAVFEAADEGQGSADSSASTTTGLVAAGDPKAIGDDAKAYFDRQLDKAQTALLRSRYADFLYDQKYTGGERKRVDYAELAVDAYVEAAGDILPEPDLTIDAAIFLLRAAFIAQSMKQPSLVDTARTAIIEGIRRLADEGRSRYTIELARALLLLGSNVSRVDLELAAQTLERGAQMEHNAGRYYAERSFLGNLDAVYQALADSSARREAQRRVAESYEADANARSVASHLAAAAHLEDAILVYQRLQMQDKVDALLRRIREQYRAGQDEFGHIEARGAIPRAEVERLFDVRLAPLSLDDALTVLGALDAFQPSYAAAQERAEGIAEYAPLSALLARTIIRDDSPTRHIQSADERLEAQIQRQFVFHINLTGIVIGLLLQRLEQDKGLNARSLGDYFERWPLMDPRHVPFLERGIERYYAGDYISALHVLTPQVEGMLRSMLWQGGIGGHGPHARCRRDRRRHAIRTIATQGRSGGAGPEPVALPGHRALSPGRPQPTQQCRSRVDQTGAGDKSECCDRHPLAAVPDAVSNRFSIVLTDVTREVSMSLTISSS